MFVLKIHHITHTKSHVISTRNKTMFKFPQKCVIEISEGVSVSLVLVLGVSLVFRVSVSLPLDYPTGFKFSG